MQRLQRGDTVVVISGRDKGKRGEVLRGAAERARRLMTIRGEVGEGAAEQGCAFRTRCPIAQERCAAERPRLDPLDVHGVACHFAAEAAARYVRAGSAP